MSFMRYLQKYALGAELMARMFLVLGSSINRFSVYFGGSVRFTYYLLLVLRKSNTFLVPGTISQQQRPSSTNITGGRTTVRQYLGNQQKTVQKLKSPENPGPYWEIAVEPTTHSAEHARRSDLPGSAPVFLFGTECTRPRSPH